MVLAGRAQRRFEIFAGRLQMAIKLNKKSSILGDCVLTLLCSACYSVRVYLLGYACLSLKIHACLL